jgi:hypothetical protein
VVQIMMIWFHNWGTKAYMRGFIYEMARGQGRSYRTSTRYDGYEHMPAARARARAREE